MPRNRAVAFEPSEEWDDLVKLGKTEPGQPPESKKKNDGSGVTRQNAECQRGDGQCGCQRQGKECKDRHAAVELKVAPFAGSIKTKDVIP